jgi:hypothetical protein
VKAHRPALHEAFERTESHPKVAKVFAQHWPAKSA